MNQPLHGIHDAEGRHLLGGRGWILITESIGCNPQDLGGGYYGDLEREGYTVIVRLNNGYGNAGTVPPINDYAGFAQRCASFVAASSGCTRWIIGNEPNHQQEWPEDNPIRPLHYAECYARCRQAIKTVQPEAEVLLAAIAPWNIQLGDPLVYFDEVCRDAGEIDGFALHAYSHGHEPDLITSEERHPTYPWHWHFRCYQDFMARIPAPFRDRPVYITEADPDEPWRDENNSWVQAAYAEIAGWNSFNRQQILALILYRWDHDGWALKDKPGVHADLRQAIARGLTQPQEPIPLSETKTPTMNTLLWPCAGPVTQHFVGNYDWYAPKSPVGHMGTDIGVPTGTPIVAGHDGAITQVGSDPDGWGFYLELHYPLLGYKALFAHLREQPPLSVGQAISRGQVVGYSGNTGKSSGPHLHYSLRKCHLDGRWITHDLNSRGYVDPVIEHVWLNERIKTATVTVVQNPQKPQHSIFLPFVASTTPIPPHIDPQKPPTLPLREWDPGLDTLGVTLIEADVPAGTFYWKLVSARWQDAQESGGRHHIYTYPEDTPMRIVWPGGSATFTGNWPMYNAGNAFSVRPDTAEPVDEIHGMGLGTPEQPAHKIHTCFRLRWERVQAN